MIEILTTGAPNTIQDGGRRGYLSAGVSRCGAMDRLAFDIGNGLIGNEPECAGLEIALFPFRLRFERDTVFAVTGADCRATLDGWAMPPCWARSAKAGQVLTLSAPRRGARAYVLLAGGIDVPPVMGSRSTDLKGGFGGLDGRGLKRGDRLACVETATRIADHGFGAVPPPLKTADGDPITVRVIRAAEFDAFDQPSRDAVLASDWQVSQDANRMGYRLSGPTLRLERSLELFSHGIVPGIVQVPSNGQPIIQLADANTCGGYPKIATVIEADLWRVAQAPAGAYLRFVETGIDDAIAAHRASVAWLDEMRRTAAGFRRL